MYVIDLDVPSWTARTSEDVFVQLDIDVDSGRGHMSQVTCTAWSIYFWCFQLDHYH